MSAEVVLSGFLPSGRQRTAGRSKRHSGERSQQPALGVASETQSFKDKTDERAGGHTGQMFEDYKVEETKSWRCVPVIEVCGRLGFLFSRLA